MLSSFAVTPASLFKGFNKSLRPVRMPYPLGNGSRSPMPGNLFFASKLVNADLCPALVPTKLWPTGPASNHATATNNATAKGARRAVAIVCFEGTAVAGASGGVGATGGGRLLHHN